MNQNLRPEEQLKEAREKARIILDEQREAAKKAELQKVQEVEKSLIRADHLNLFLQSLNSELRNALTEVRASSQSLAEIASELDRATAHHNQH